MNHACMNCSHYPDAHEGGGCTGELTTLWGVEPCGCGVYEKDTDE